MKKPLTSQEDPSEILPAAIRYNVSNEWDKNESGLLLEVPSGEVLQAGGYRATILWQVEQTP